MIQLNKEQYLPTKYFLYIVIKIAIYFLLLSAILLMVKMGGWIGFLSVFFILPALFFAWFEGRKTSFQINENKIAISGGIVDGRTKIIPYGSIKNIEIRVGVLRSLMGLATVNFWTTSPDQRIAKENEPDGRLCLEGNKAKWLASFIAKGGRE